MLESGPISAEELKKRLDANWVDFLFDLRNVEEFKIWRIEGKKDIETLNIPQEEFVGEEELYLSKFPMDKNIVTVCAHGDSAKYAADLLQGYGINAFSLIGGMDSWSELCESNKICDDPAIYQFFRVAHGCLAYLIVSDGEALVIDVAAILTVSQT